MPKKDYMCKKFWREETPVKNKWKETAISRETLDYDEDLTSMKESEERRIRKEEPQL